MSKTAEPSSEKSDRDLAALFAPAIQREMLSVFYAWVDEIEQIPAKAHEPAIQAMRFAWHREAVDHLYANPPKIRRHAAYEGLAKLISYAGINQADLIAIVDSIEAGLDPDALTDQRDLRVLIDRHSGTVTRLVARICGDEQHAIVAAAGRVIGFGRWVSGFAVRAGRSMALVPQSDLQAAGFNTHRLATGREADLAALAFAATLDNFELALTEMDNAGPCPASLFPVLGAARLARHTLKTARRTDDLYRTDFARSQIARQFDLIVGSLTGRL